MGVRIRILEERGMISRKRSFVFDTSFWPICFVRVGGET